MARTRDTFSNCLLGVLYLCLRGQASRVAVVSAHAWYCLHFAAFTKRGHALHFRYKFPQKPMWFLGHFQGVSRSQVPAELDREGRTILAVAPARLFLPLGILYAVAWYPVWLAYWAARPLVQMAAYIWISTRKYLCRFIGRATRS